MEYDKLANEKTEMQRHYVMVRGGEGRPGGRRWAGWQADWSPGGGCNLSVPSELSQPPSAGYLGGGGGYLEEGGREERQKEKPKPQARHFCPAFVPL